ncbi:hypothetical protein PRUPE_8G119900 [Prunus persica]|uniref:Uncharacterized protein n=1 Tax=Prunus persica TaxID=3760 RepID=A0A251MZT6_PRUPE|nr:hypothetical protein PRUPE_8G119900 [Prunus persica]
MNRICWAVKFRKKNLDHVRSLSVKEAFLRMEAQIRILFWLLLRLESFRYWGLQLWRSSQSCFLSCTFYYWQLVCAHPNTQDR